MLDVARRKFMNFTQQQKEAELARLDDEIRQKVSDAALGILYLACCSLMLDKHWQSELAAVEVSIMQHPTY